MSHILAGLLNFAACYVNLCVLSKTSISLRRVGLCVTALCFVIGVIEFLFAFGVFH